MIAKLYFKSLMALIAALLFSTSCSSDPKEPEEVVNEAMDDEAIELDELSSIEDAEDEADDSFDEESGSELADEESQPEDYSLEDDGEMAESAEDETNIAAEEADEMEEEVQEQFDGLEAEAQVASANAEAVPVEDEMAMEEEAESAPAEFAAEPTNETQTIATTQTSAASKGYIVMPGDSLGRIAFKIYGDSGRWRDLADWNSINDPGRIFPGDVITYNEDNATARGFATAQSSQVQTVEVKAGDSLSKISQEIFGDAGGWKYLWTMNKDFIKNPNQIFVGQTLKFTRGKQMAKL